MGLRLTRDSGGISAIVREYYRKNYGSVGIDVDIDMDQLTVTVCRMGHRQIHRIQRIFINDKPLYCVHALEREE